MKKFNDYLISIYTANFALVIIKCFYAYDHKYISRWKRKLLFNHQFINENLQNISIIVPDHSLVINGAKTQAIVVGNHRKYKTKG